AQDVQNHGIIRAPDGQVLLAAGSQVNLVDTYRPDIQVSLSAPAGGEAVNVGQLVGGQVGIYAAAIRQQGAVQATGAHVDASGEIIFSASRTLEVAPGASVSADALAGGRIRLQAGDTAQVAGTVSATGSAGNGGQVELLGRHVDVLDGARIDASGSSGGGRLMVLGNMVSGTTAVGGVLLAEARATGNGGFIETSAATVRIADSARLSTRATAGQAGLWLIDPHDFTIAASGGDISGAALSSNLAAGNVEIQSTQGANASGNGDIFVNDAVSWSANTLTLTALRHININAVMTASGSSTLVLNPATTIGAETGIPDGAVRVGFNPDGSFRGRVDFPGRTGAGFLTIGGEGYFVINALGSSTSTSGSDLQGMRGNLSRRYALGANIDASSTSGWNGGAGFVPVGGGFTGKFDGLGHTITGLTINRPSTNFVGLFGSTSTGSSIANVGLEGGSVTGGYSTGGLVGSHRGTVTNSYSTRSVTGTGWYIGGLVGGNGGTVTHSYATGSVMGNTEVGGLVGTNFSGTITNSYATGSVTSTSGYAGGLVGYNRSPGTVTDSYATGNVTSPFGSGGLVGANQSTVTKSYATGSVSGADFTGGLVGINDGTVTESYAVGSVSGTSSTGGLAGYNPGTVTDSYAAGGVTGANYTGGLAGYNLGTVTNSYAIGSVSGTSSTGGLIGSSSGWIDNSYATGSVTGTAETGGLVGFNDGAILTNSFWNTQTSGQSSSAGGTGLSTAQMRDPASFTGWDLSGVWSLQNAARPFLRSFQQPLTATVGNASFTYNATAYAGTPSITYSVAGFTPGGTPVFDYGAEPKNAGTYAINACCLSTQQYAATVTPGTLTINRAPITITGGSSTSTYTAGAQTNTFSASGLLGSDSVSSVSGRASGTSAGTYLDTLSGATGTGLGNYSITYVNGALTITPAPLTITGASSTSTYTAGAQTNTFTASGLLGSDGVASVSGRASGTNAGTYLDALSGATGTGLGNYTITYVNGALTITPAPLTMPQPAPNANDRAQIDIRRLTSVPDAVRLEVTPSFVFRLVLPLVPPREQPLSTLPQTHPGF
ncbi:MAG: hypothetical protein ING80_04160, partial [Rhodocyclaceae bacterium]|nr:hypothetical protein [Rhodocyclaceae bacterium]